jgi:hypothetical protein
VDAAEDWLVREGVLRPSGETTIERMVYAARAQAEGRMFADIVGQLGQGKREGLDALCAPTGATAPSPASPLHPELRRQRRCSPSASGLRSFGPSCPTTWTGTA